MARPLRIDFEDGVFHVTSHGRERRVVVRDDQYWQRWLELLGRVAVHNPPEPRRSPVQSILDEVFNEPGKSAPPTPPEA